MKTLWILSDIFGVIGAVLLAVAIHAPSPSKFALYIASALIVMGALSILLQDLAR
jgi:hypothetical protein